MSTTVHRVARATTKWAAAQSANKNCAKPCIRRCALHKSQ